MSVALNRSGGWARKIGIESRCPPATVTTQPQNRPPQRPKPRNLSKLRRIRRIRAHACRRTTRWNVVHCGERQTTEMNQPERIGRETDFHWRRCLVFRIRRQRTRGFFVSSQHRAHHGRRFGVRRCGLLQRRVEDFDAAHGWVGSTGNAIHRRSHAFISLYALALRPVDGPLRLAKSFEEQRAGPGRNGHEH